MSRKETETAQTTAAWAGTQQVSRKVSRKVSWNLTHETPQKRMYHWPQD